MHRPNLFIIGAPKSGTSSLYDYLDGHPEVYMSAVKEPSYFCPDVQGGSKSRLTFEVDEQQYMALYAEAQDEKYLGEASTRYLASPMAPRLISEFEPTARIVAMLRNPVDMVYALHNERISHGSEDVADFEQALALDDDRRRGHHLPFGSNPLGAAYRDNARFGEQIQRWQEAFGPEQVRVIIFEDFAADTSGEFRKLLKWLAIDSGYQPARFAVRNPSHRSRGGLIRALFDSPLARWTRRGLLPRLLGEHDAARLARRLRHSRLNRRLSPRPPLGVEVRRELEAYFAPDVALLSRLLGRDLGAQWFDGPLTSDKSRGEAEVE